MNEQECVESELHIKKYFWESSQKGGLHSKQKNFIRPKKDIVSQLAICRNADKNNSKTRNQDMHTYTYVISPNNRPGTSDRKEVTVTASGEGEARKKVKEMYPNAFFYGGVRIDKH